jgi:hypothetical protein
MVLVLLVLAILVGTFVITATVVWRVKQRPELAIFERPYMLAPDESAGFDEIVRGILHDDPGFLARCRELLDHGE